MMVPVLVACLLSSSAALKIDPRTFSGSNNAAGDAKCSAGLLSLPEAGQEWQVCCPAYCGSCSDYHTCSSVGGQNSRDACCASRVKELQCGHGAAANVCLHTCSKHGPPCIMDFAVSIPEVSHSAGDDCNEAVSNWRATANAAMDAAKDNVQADLRITKAQESFQASLNEYNTLKDEVDKDFTVAQAKYDKDAAKLETVMRDGTIKPEFRDRARKYVESIKTLMSNLEDSMEACDLKEEELYTEMDRDMKMSGQLMTASAAQDKFHPAMDDVRNKLAKLNKYLSENPEFPATQ